jgi:GT2 family glycosyltransferase
MTKQNKKVFVVIPVHNRLDDTINCLEAFSKQDYKNYAIIIVDDGSVDGTSKYIEEKFSDIVLLNGDGNLWWTGAVNEGVKYAINEGSDSDYVLTINNDVRVRNNFLSLMVEASEIYRNTIINPLTVDIDTDKIISSGNKMLSWILAASYHPHYGKKLDQIDRSKTISVHMLTGRGTIIPIKVFKKIGLYDNIAFPQYGGDNEFTCRANKNGFNLMILPKSAVYVKKETTGLDPIYRNISLSQIIESFFSIRSTNNLAMRIRFARRCCPAYAQPSYFIITLLKIFSQSFIFNYLKRLSWGK